MATISHFHYKTMYKFRCTTYQQWLRRTLFIGVVCEIQPLFKRALFIILTTEHGRGRERRRRERKKERGEGERGRIIRMCGIFAYLNYNVNKERRYILEVLFNGLRRLEYRGYDSAGISIDASPIKAASADSNHNSDSSVSLPPLVFRKEGKIESLVKSVYHGML